jgi:hypothetical protein
MIEVENHNLQDSVFNNYAESIRVAVALTEEMTLATKSISKMLKDVALITDNDKRLSEVLKIRNKIVIMSKRIQGELEIDN